MIKESGKFSVVRKLPVVAAVVGALALGGCASVPMASHQQDMAAKQFKPAPRHEARIYLYRNEEFGAAVKLAVSLDGMSMGQTAPYVYFMWNVAPGRHTIESYSGNAPKISIDAKAGHLYFVRQEIEMGLFSPRSALHAVSKLTGERGVRECKLAKSQH